MSLPKSGNVPRSKEAFAVQLGHEGRRMQETFRGMRGVMTLPQGDGTERKHETAIDTGVVANSGLEEKLSVPMKTNSKRLQARKVRRDTVHYIEDI